MAIPWHYLLRFAIHTHTVTGEFPAQRTVTRSFDVFFDLRLSQQLSKQSICWCFETPSRSLWRHCNGLSVFCYGLVPVDFSVALEITSIAPMRVKQFLKLCEMYHTYTRKDNIILRIRSTVEPCAYISYDTRCHCRSLTRHYAAWLRFARWFPCGRYKARLSVNQSSLSQHIQFSPSYEYMGLLSS